MGPPCVGKTAFKSLLSNWPGPKVHHSTSLATRPVRAVERVAERSEGKIWDRVTGRDAICALEQQSDDVNDPTLENAATSTNVSSLSTSYITGYSSKEIKVVPSPIQFQQNMFSTDPDSYSNEMVNVLAEREISEDLHKATWAYFLDAGGQPQFTDVLRALNRGNTINTICANLKENPSDNPQFLFSINGELLNQPSELQMTSMQLIKHFMRSVAASKSMAIVDGNQKLLLQPRFMITGTYYGKTRLSQFFKFLHKKNAQILDSLSEFCDHFIFCNESPQKVIFPVDNLFRLKISSSIHQFIDLLVGIEVKVRKIIVGGRKIGRKKVLAVAHYNKTKGFKKKIDLYQKNVQLLSALHEFHENFILVENSCTFTHETFLSLICDQMSSSYFILVILPYCQLIDRDKSVFEKSCDPVMIVSKSNTVPQVSLLIIIINY